MLNYSPLNNAAYAQGYYNIPTFRASSGVPTGMMPKGMTQQPGMTQPGMAQSGMMQPGMMQPGMVQPGMVQPGMVQPGMMQPGMAQPVVPSIPAGSAIPGVAPVSPAPVTPGMLPLEQSFIENILRLNLGKIGTFYMTYENNSQWNAKIFKGKLEAAGRDHIIISDPKTGMRTLLLMVNLDYATFDEELKYSSPYQIGNR